MSAAATLLARLEAAGVTVELSPDGAGLALQAAAALAPDLLAECRRLKPGLLALLRSDADLLPIPEIVALVEALAAATAADQPARAFAAARRMRLAGHCHAEIAATLLPAVPLPPSRQDAIVRSAIDAGIANAALERTTP